MNGTRVNPDDYGDEIVRLYQDENYSAPQIADILGLPVHQVRKQLKKHDIVMDTAKRSAKSQRLPEALPLIEQGLSLHKVAQQTGISYQTLLRWLREEGQDTGAQNPQIIRQQEGTAEVVRLYVDEQQTSEQIAKALDMAQGTVLKWLRDAGVSIRTARGGSKPVKRDALLPEVVRLNEEGVTLGEIAKRVDASEWSVGQWLRQEGLKPHYSARDAGDGEWKAKYAGLREQVRALYSSGVRVIEIAKQMGLHTATVNDWIGDIREQGGVYKQNAESQAEAVRLYQDEGLNIQEVCEGLGKSYPSVRGWLTEAGVHIRSSWEQKTDEQRQALWQAASAANLGTSRKVDGVVPRQHKPRTTPPKKSIKTSCAAPDCTRTTGSPNRKYCSDAHRMLHALKRQGDPANTVETPCRGCGDMIKHPRSQARKYCSKCANHHTRTRRNIVIRDDDTVLDSRWEAAVVGLCAMVKLSCDRFDREQGVEWNGLGSWYAPDFTLPTVGVALEVKGQQDSDDHLRWAAYREQRGLLAVIGEDELDALRLAASSSTMLADQVREIAGRPIAEPS